MRPRSGTVEAVIRMLATTSHGVVTRRELLQADVTADQIKSRLQSGALLPVHPGVYRVGHSAPSVEARYLGAVKACGDRAMLGGCAAAYLWRLLKGPAPEPEVLAPAKRTVRGVITHRARRGDLHDATTCRGVPITTVPRSLVDLAAVLAESALARACHEAGVLHRTTPAQVKAVLERRPTSPGRATLERILEGEVRVTLSRLESRFLARLREAHLPLPETNRLAGGRRVDCRWPERHLTVELDGYRYHNSRHAWEQDRRREREARARGDEFRRFTYTDVVEDPTHMLAELHSLLT